MTIDALYGDTSIIGTSPEQAAWSLDAKRLIFLWNDHGAGFRDVWSYDPATKARAQLTHLGDGVHGQARKGVTRAVPLAGGRVAFVVDGALQIVGADGAVTPAEPQLKGISKLAASPDGASIAFVSGGALWAKMADGAARALVAGADKLAIDSFEWAPDGKAIAFVQADTRGMRQIEIAYDAGGTAHRDTLTRPFPGDPTALRKIGVVPVAGGVVRWLERPDEREPIWDCAISPDGRSLFVNSSDFVIKTHSIYTYDLASGRRTTFYRFADPQQIRPDWQAAWLPDSRGLILLTNRDGYNHLYRIAAPGAAPRAITRGPWEIETFWLDGAHGQLFFTANRSHYADRTVYRVPLAGGAIHAVSERHGTHAPAFSPDFTQVADRFSDDMTPPDLYVAPTTAEAALAQVTRSPLPAFADRRWASVRYVDFKSHVDGAPLTARVMLPADYQPGKRYPLIVGSVYSDAVHNQWGGRVAHPTWGLDQAFAHRGYILLNVGIRGSFGRGKAWNAPMRGNYGTLDIEDHQDGVRYLVDQGLADAKRVGIWGSSYGGLMTLSSLFKKPGFYAAGIAGAPASNVWHAFPEQEWIAGEPTGADMPGRYEKQSPYWHAQNLTDPLMIIHGTRDDVVLYSDTIALAQKLIANGKSFELVSLPGAHHPWDMEGLDQTRFAFRKMIDFFDCYLKPDGAALPK